MTNKPEWIDANEALLIVEKVLQGRSEAKRAIAECLRDGVVRAVAAERWISGVRQIGDAWSAEAKRENYRKGCLIEAKSFRASKRWGFDQDEWRWPFNKFSISSKISPSVRRHMFSGVMLNRLDIERVILRRNPTGVGSPGKSGEWTALCRILLEMERQGELNAVTHPTMTSLREEVLSRMDEGLGDKTIKPAISQLWKLFVAERLPAELDR